MGSECMVVTLKLSLPRRDASCTNVLMCHDDVAHPRHTAHVTRRTATPRTHVVRRRDTARNFRYMSTMTTPSFAPKAKQIGFTATTPGNWSPVPTNDEDAINQLAANRVLTQVYYDNGATSNPAQGIYGDFPSAFAAASALTLPYLVLVQSGTVPAGTYVLPPTMFITSVDFADLDIQNGASFVASDYNTLDLDLATVSWANTSAPVFSLPSKQFNLILNGTVLVADSSATQPFIETSATGSVIISTADDCVVDGAVGAPVLSASGTEVSFVWLSQMTTLGEDSLAGTGQINIIVFDPSAIYSLTQPAATNVKLSIGGGTPTAQVGAVNETAQSFADGAASSTITNWIVLRNQSGFPSGSFNATTGVFTCPASGLYPVTAQLEYNAIASNAGGEFTCSILHNGTLIMQGVNTCPVAGSNVKRTVSATVLVGASQGDTISIQGSQSSGLGSAVTLSGSQYRNTLSIGFMPS